MADALLTVSTRGPGPAPPEPTSGDEYEHGLLRRVSTGDEAAFDALFTRYWPRLVSYAERLLGDSPAAADLTQQVLAKLWLQRTQLQVTGKVSAYLYRAMHNAAVDLIRRDKARQRGIEQLARVEPPGENSADLAEADDLVTSAEEAIQALPPRRREVFTLAHLHNLRYAEIAAALGISEHTVANHMSLALADLRRALAPFLRPEAGTPSAPGVSPRQKKRESD